MQTSHVAVRTRRTTALKGGQDGDTSYRNSSKQRLDKEDADITSSVTSRQSRRTRPSRSSGSSSTSTEPTRHNSLGSVDRRKKKSGNNSRSLQLDGGSYHSRISYDSRANSYADASITLEELKRARSISTTPSTNASFASNNSYNDDRKTRKGQARRQAEIRTPSLSTSKQFTISCSNGINSSGNYRASSNESITSCSTPLSAVVPDLFSSKHLNTTRIQENPFVNTPLTCHSTFEVDAPREVPARPPSPSDISMVSESVINDPRLSREQDAWAGIDALLETRSLNDSFTFSTADILPSSTVQAMRKGDDVSILLDDDISEFSEMPIVLKKKKPGTQGKPEKNEGMPSLVEASDQDEDSDSRNGGGGVLGGGGGGGGNGTLFDVFHWSEKDNVDDKQQTNKKLNRRRRVQLKANSNHDHSDTTSLPSLATFRDDDHSTRSEVSEWRSFQDKGSVVTEDVHTMQQDWKKSWKTASDAPIPQNITASDAPTIASANNAIGGKLVFDKQVDDYIRKIQKQLPTISEHGSPQKDGKKRANAAFLIDEELEKVAAGTERTPFDELPSLSSLCNQSGEIVSDQARSSGNGIRKQEEKREPNQPFSTVLMKSIKGIRAPKTPKPQNKGVVKGDEEKYFPEEVKQDSSKHFSANRFLLIDSAGEDADWGST